MIELARRRMMMGGSAKPYDAEVEWIESTGTQYIDTGVLMNTLTDEMRLEYLITNKTNFCGVAGARLGASSRSVTVSYNGNIASIDCTNSDYNNSRALIKNNEINIRYLTISSITYRAICQGTTVLDANNIYSDVFTSNSIYVFAVNGIVNKASIRLYNFTIRSNTAKIDLIPVRKNGIGYMYDKVSGQLFGNQGTGQFIIGPDKTA